MISVILYGRNDSYGYNLPKRAVMSINCIAEVLTHPEDEIIFIDCNTPDDAPTFTEAVQDLFTAKARRLLRTLRLRPAMYRKYSKNSPLKALEPLSRNIAIRRSNPANRWVLSTNTDMIFIVRDGCPSLSDLAAGLPDGFYELPRFEVPEALWESLDRTDPGAALSAMRLWGRRLHLNDAVESEKEIRYDGPGDFQLILRDQIFKIDGFNEEMVLGWHVDSNICKRLYLLNGQTSSLLDKVFAYHLDHTRQATFMHTARTRTENDLEKFIWSVDTPFLPEQRDNWGCATEEIEEIISGEDRNRFDKALEALLPGMHEDVSFDIMNSDSFNHGEIYDTTHVFPFLANHLGNLPPAANVGYFGANQELLSLMGRFLQIKDHKGALLTDSSFSDLKPEGGLTTGKLRVIGDSDYYIFDMAMMHFPLVKNPEGIVSVKPSQDVEKFRAALKEAFHLCVYHEKKRLSGGFNQPRKFIFISSQHTWFEEIISHHIGVVLAPYSSHVRHGYLIGAAEPSSISLKAGGAKEVAEFIGRNIRNGDKILAPAWMGLMFPGLVYPHAETVPHDEGIRWSVTETGQDGPAGITGGMKRVFSSGPYTVYSSQQLQAESAPVKDRINGQ